MKALLKLPLSVFCVLLLMVSCSREPEFQPENGIPTLGAFKPYGEISYSDADFKILLADQHSEEAFVGKTQLLTYSLTRFFGEHFGLGNGAELRVVIPCDMGLSTPDQTMRLMSAGSGMDINDVTLALSGYVEACLKDCQLPKSEKSELFTTLLSSLQLEGSAYDLFTRFHHIPPQSPQTTILVGYGVGYGDEGMKAYGTQYDLNSGEVTQVSLDPQEAIERGMMLLSPRPTGGHSGPLRFNDPCFYANGGGNGGGGGTGGGTGGGGGTGPVDDDGSAKNGFSGGLVSPPGFSCPGPSGLRITEMHLASRKEGGLFSGKSEIYINASAYSSLDPGGTVKTNDLSPKTRTISLFGVPVTYKIAKQLAEVPPSEISATSQIILTPSSGYNPTNSSDWVLLEGGFCDLAFGGYDRFYITFYERDNPRDIFGVTTWQRNDPDLANIFQGNMQYCEMTLFQDKWMETTLSPADFIANGTTVYVQGNGAGNSIVSTTQPAPGTSWIRVELY